jgi:hypothetical protein
MKIKNSTLRRIIREEYTRMINEEEEKELTREEALDGLVSDNRGAGSSSGQGAAMLKLLIDIGKVQKGNLKGLVDAYDMKVSPAQKKALGL